MLISSKFLHGGSLALLSICLIVNSKKKKKKKYHERRGVDQGDEVIGCFDQLNLSRAAVRLTATGCGIGLS